MEFRRQTDKSEFVRISALEDKAEIGYVYLYLIKNDAHKDQPYGLIEDLFVHEEYRKKGVGSALVKEALSEARAKNCYKVLGTSRMSRPEVHRFYEKLGLKKHGFEFRVDL